MNRLPIPGLELPVIQVPMAGVQDSALALAVCHAGGIGSLPAATEMAGSTDFTPLWCGQNPLCPNQPTAEITRRLAPGFSP
jgi:NAD(P)H-dependent flavin oxidoreductase YrpB (nitropropane dioxygenase family)